MGFLKKIEKGANRFFKKLDLGANTAFKKIGKGMNEAGDFAENAVDKVAGVGKQVGNFLEKNAGNIAMAGAGLAAGVAPAILAAGATAQQAGSRLKNASQNTQRIKNQINSVRDRGQDFTNNLNNTVQGAINQGNRTSQNMINQAQNATVRFGV